MFLGRDRELGEIVAALDRVRSASSGALFLLSGEPGIGKTRLAAEATRAGRGKGVTSAVGRCWEAGGAPAFWPWREAFDTLGIRFPDPTAIMANDPAETRFAMFQELARRVLRSGAERPLLLVLEDLHAADRSTLLALESLAAKLADASVLVIGTYRDLEARLRGEVTDSIARLGRAGRVLQLGRLHGTDVAAMVRDAFGDADDDLVATVFETTDGNPLFVDEIVRDIRAHGRRSAMPLGVSEVIRQRLGFLSIETRAVLEAAAVLGVELATADLARWMPGSAPALDEASDRAVLTRLDGRARFSHALYREALYYDLPYARRQALHREAAAALASRGASNAELAHHLFEAGPDSVRDAVERAIAAAEQAVESFAYDDALHLLRRARAAIPPTADEARLRCRVMIALGETSVRAGDAGGRETCVAAHEAARELADAELAARAALAYGSTFLMGGIDPVLVSMLERALVELPGSDSGLRARVMARLAAARQPSPPAERQRDVDLGLEAIAMARRLGDRRDLLAVLHAASGVLYNRVAPAVRVAVSLDQERLAEDLGDTGRLLHAKVRLAIDHLEQADLASYARLATGYAALAERIGPAATPWRLPLMRSMLAIARDDFVESERQQAEARRIAGDSPRARRAEAFHRIGFLRAAERHAELRAAVPELRGLWLAMPYGSVLSDAHVASLLARIGADEDLRALVAGLSDAAVGEEINAAVLGDAVWATGDVELARRIEPQLRFMGDRWHIYWFDCELVDGPNARSLAYIAAVQDRWDECDRLFAHAISDVEAVGRRSLAARMRFELGDLMRRKGHDAVRAHALLREGRDQARALALPELAALVDRRHPDLGGGPAIASHQAHSPAFVMRREGEFFTVTGSRGLLRFKATRGMEYLAVLASRPNVDVHVLELAGAAELSDRGDAGELVDTAALGAYRARLTALKDTVEDAEALGHVERAAKARDEMETIARELSRATKTGGRRRRAESAVDRARSAVQRRIKDALDRVAEQDADLGARLKSAIRTGNYCSFRSFR